MADQTVKTTQRSWAAECAAADARYDMDSASAGVVAVKRLQQPAAYVFSNGRSFQPGPKASSSDT